MLHRLVEPGQYVSFAFTQRLIDEGVDPSVETVGDAYDNALAESQIGLYKTELIRPEGPWRGVEHVELETLNWVDFFNNDPTSPSMTSPDGRRGTSLRCTKRAPADRLSHQTKSPDMPGRFNVVSSR